MGTFVRCEMDDSLRVPEELRERYLAQMEVLFRQGGMMTLHHPCMFDRQITTMDLRPKRHSLLNGTTYLYYTYHYHDQDCCPEVGICLDTLEVYSDKIDGEIFQNVVPAAYVLEALYATGMYAYTADDHPRSTHATTVWISGWVYAWLYHADAATGWLNCILGERFWNLHCDMWRLFEFSKREDLLGWKKLDNWFARYGAHNYSGDSWVETIYVCDDASVNPENTGAEQPDKDKPAEMYTVGRIYRQIQEYRNASSASDDEQIALLTRMWNEFFRKGQVDMDIVGTDEEHLHNMREIATRCNQPALIIKAMAEVYGRDFWELWEPVSEAANCSRLIGVGPEPNMTTAEFLRVSPDELIYLWTAENPIIFSKELQQWFRSLRRQYNRLLHENWTYERPIYRIFRVLDDADREYGHILAFQSCLEESMDHSGDRRYHTLWKMFERMVYSRRMLDSINKIRVKGGFNNADGQWQHHPTRRHLRHYLALIANKELRETVFGF